MLGVVLAAAALMFCYLRIAGATEVNADGDGLVLQAADMLHGNLLLHGWWDTDVSFITTELPEYMVVTKVAGIRPEVVHICAALTYTLLVLLAAFVARGRARGAEGVVRALLAAGVMLAPQAAGPTPVLLGSPDHVGTAVPLLLLLLLLDRAPPRQARLRWYIPACVGVCIVTAALLGWVVVGDPLAEVVGVIPLVLACLLQAIRIVLVRAVTFIAGRVRVWRTARAGGERVPADAPAADTWWRAAVFYVLLAAAAAAAVPLARTANTWIGRHAGYQLGPNRYGLLPWSAIVKNGPSVWQSFLALFGADYSGVTGTGNVVFARLHLVGVAVVIAAAGFAVWRLLVPARGARAGDLVADFLLLGVVVNIAAYFAFIVPLNIYNAHEIGPVVSFGAALTGRMLGGPVSRFRFRIGRVPVLPAALAVVLAGYAALLGIAATAPQGPPQDTTLATWLTQHHLRSGIASYWEASSVTVDSNDKVIMLAVGIHGENHKLAPDAWETDVQLGNEFTHSADFVVAGPDRIVPVKLTVEMFGRPLRTYRYGPYTIMVYGRNLLGQLNPISPPPSAAGALHAAGQGDAAVQDQGLAGDPARLVGQQERDRARDVFWHPEALERVGGRHLILAALVQRRGELRLHHGRRHRVHPDAGAEFHGELRGQPDQGRLADPVQADPGAGTQAGDGGNVHDRAAVLTHPRVARQLGPGERGEDVDRQDLGRRRQVGVGDGTVDGVDAGVVDEHVQPAERLDRPGHGFCLVVGVIGLAGHRDGHVRPAELGHGRCQRLRAAGGEAHPGPLPHQLGGDPEPDAPAGAGDDGDTFLERFHVLLPVVGPAPG